MDWQNTPESTNIEDRRGSGGGISLGGGGAGGLGIGAILIIGLISYFTGIDPRILIGGAQIVTGSGGGSIGAQELRRPASRSTPMIPQLVLMKHVLGETEAVWGKVLPAQKNVRYTPATLVVYDGATNSGCGTAQAAMGPFYCPDDKKVYLDMAFFREMQSKLGGGGDFAYAYVIAHEIGHHVQDLLGILEKVDDAKQSLSRTDANALSVRVELQADCLAGVWAANANTDLKLTQADIQQAISTAQAIGDDTLQTAARGYAVPDSFTHGSSAQRVQWLTTGLKSGQVDACNTFAR